MYGNIITELTTAGATVREYPGSFPLTCRDRVRGRRYLPEAEISPTRQSRTQVDIPLAMVDAVNTATPVLLMVHDDHLGRPVRMTNSAKASVWDVTYTPWGAPHALTGAQTLNTRCTNACLPPAGRPVVVAHTRATAGSTEASRRAPGKRRG